MRVVTLRVWAAGRSAAPKARSNSLIRLPRPVRPPSASLSHPAGESTAAGTASTAAAPAAAGGRCLAAAAAAAAATSNGTGPNLPGSISQRWWTSHRRAAATAAADSGSCSSDSDVRLARGPDINDGRRTSSAP